MKRSLTIMGIMLFVVAALYTGMPVLEAQFSSLNYKEPGGARLVIGGDLDVVSGGEIVIESGGTFSATGLTTMAAINQQVVIVPDGAAYDVLATNTGKTHVVPDQTNDITMDLPPEAAGLYYKFIYAGAAEDANDWLIDSEADANFFIGGAVQHDIDGELIVTYYSNGSSNSILGVLTPGAGTEIEIWCDGTHWYLSGTVVSATDTGVTFSDQ